MHYDGGTPSLIASETLRHVDCLQCRAESGGKHYCAINVWRNEAAIARSCKNTCTWTRIMCVDVEFHPCGEGFAIVS